MRILKLKLSYVDVQKLKYIDIIYPFYTFISDVQHTEDLVTRSQMKNLCNSLTVPPHMMKQCQFIMCWHTQSLKC